MRVGLSCKKQGLKNEINKRQLGKAKALKLWKLNKGRCAHLEGVRMETEYVRTTDLSPTEVNCSSDNNHG